MLERPTIDVVRKLYEGGLSTRQIAAQTNWSKSRVHKMVHGITRTRSIAAVLRQPQKSRHWRTCRANARALMQRFLGRKLLRTEHVHHKDHDYTHNVLENLEVKPATLHLQQHNPKNPIPRHKRPERIAWIQKWNALNRYIPATCAWCHKHFNQDKYTPKRTCSRSCGAYLFWYERKDKS